MENAYQNELLSILFNRRDFLNSISLKTAICVGV